ncbi:hypothetical protein DFH11DRAFT_1603214 [Phellopilus nigrolimitatus]|nr:hypothetical protein DFH11DRAFT_1603214 [Phellopilus nigrolimitatus]
MPKHLGYEAWVQCGGRRIKEWRPEVIGNVVTCWIASKPGKTFEIQFRNHRHLRVSTLVKFAVDGRFESSMCINVDDDNDPPELVMLGIPVDRKSWHPFKFCEQSWTDDEALLRDEADLGLISVKVSQVRAHRLHVKDRDVYPKLRDNDFVSENKKKLIPHSVGFGENTVETETFHAVEMESLDGEGEIEVFVSFNFKFRPHDLLQAEGIVHIPIPRETNQPSRRSQRIAESNRVEYKQERTPGRAVCCTPTKVEEPMDDPELMDFNRSPDEDADHYEREAGDELPASDENATQRLQPRSMFSSQANDARVRHEENDTTHTSHSPVMFKTETPSVVSGADNVKAEREEEKTTVHFNHRLDMCEEEIRLREKREEIDRTLAHYEEIRRSKKRRVEVKRDSERREGSHHDAKKVKRENSRLHAGVAGSIIDLTDM